MHTLDRDLESIQAARELARKGKLAAHELSTYTEEQIDKILRSMVEAAEKHAATLAEMAVEETGFGIPKDKLYKNHMASGLLYEQIKDRKTIGIIDIDEHKQMISVAEPVGLIMGIVPSTNPTSTIFFKSLIAMKSRNAIVFSPHPAAAKCSLAAINILHQAAVEAGAPVNCIQGIELSSIEATNELMHSPEVSLIIATGGPGMVKAAYSAGKPALGVGAGNSPAYIEKSANVHEAVKAILCSKTFDNGTICASEQSIICESSNRDAVIAELKAQGGYFMNEEECDKVCKLLFRGGQSMNPKFVGRSALVIAEAAGIHVPPTTRVLVGEQKGVGPKWPLSYEKLTTVLAFYTVADWEEACELSIELLQNGIGHTMSLHTEDKDIVRKFSVKPASRILINTGGTMGGTGLSTGLDISLTLGCGTWGGSSISENVGPEHLINIKRVVYGIKDVTRLIEDDELYQRYHGTAALAHSEQARPCASNYAGSELPQYQSSQNSYKKYEKSGISYSPSCSCKGSQTASSSTQEEALDLEELQEMIDAMVQALKGE